MSHGDLGKTVITSRMPYGTEPLSAPAKSSKHTAAHTGFSSVHSPAGHPPSIQIVGDYFEPGTMLDHYELIRYIGGGGMGRVWLAMDTRLERHVALKLLHHQQITDPEIVERFQEEARAAARLNHTNIVQIFGMGACGSFLYIVMEYIKGENIRDRVEHRGAFSVSEAVTYTMQIVEALEHLDAHHIVHRDIKPSNILITPEGQAKLIDLGLARVTSASEDKPEAELTAAGVTLGTFDYISPEQARDSRNVDVRSDIYSLGCTLFFMVTGRPPFPEGNAVQKLLAHNADALPNLRKLRIDIPDSLIRVMECAAAKDPRKRFQTPQEMSRALDRVARQIGLYPLGWGYTGVMSRGRWLASRHRMLPMMERFRKIKIHLPWLLPLILFLLAIIIMKFVWTPSLTDLGSEEKPSPVMLPPGL